MESVKSIRKKYESLNALFNERTRRIWAATEAQAIGTGGVARVAEATGMSRTTIFAGLREIKNPGDEPALAPDRIRRPGGGRKPVTETDPTILADLEALVAPTTRGDPESPLRWTLKSTYRISDELQNRISPRKVAQLLKKIGYQLQSNRKTKEGSSHPDRNAQFEYINKSTQKFQKKNQPVISVDTKKKELIGNFKNNGKEWRPKGKPDEVNVHDFKDPELGKVSPYGIYDITANQGYVNVGIDHDTAEFAVGSITRWWRKMGSKRYPDATEILIIADGGGSNSSRSRLWKKSLQNFANKTGLKISVSHFPPGTSKWNKIEHRMFSFITMNWRGKPLVSHEIVVKLIANTTTKSGLKIQASLDKRKYPKGIKVSDTEMKELKLKRAAFHGDWNYTIEPYK